MSKKLFIHPQTDRILTALSKNMPHALIMSGPRGSGLTSLALHIVTLTSNTKVQTIEPDEKNTIGIDAIRDLYQQTRSKQAPRTIIIKDADRMTIAAQNAFLKLLEEPNEGVSFLLTTHASTRLLPTITSRAQQVTAQPITSEQTNQLLDTLNVSHQATRAQLLFLANGLPAEIARLVGDEAYFTSKATIIRDARTLLQAATYDKLLLINRYTDRHKALQLLGALLQIIHVTLLQKPHNSMIEQLDTFLIAEDRIRENGHVRTQLLRAVL